MSLLLVPPWMDWTFKAIGWSSVVVAIAALIRFLGWLLS